MNQPPKRSVQKPSVESSSPSEGFQIRESAPSHKRYLQKRKPVWQMPVAIGGVVLVLVAGGYWLFGRSTPPPPSVSFQELKLVTAPELAELRVEPDFEVSNLDRSEVRFSLEDAPAGVVVHEKTGAILWTPAEEQGPGKYTFTLSARQRGESVMLAETKVTIEVTEALTAPIFAPSSPQSVQAGDPISIPLFVTDSDLPVQEIHWEILPNSQTSVPTLKVFRGTSNEFKWTPPRELPAGGYEFTVRAFKPGEKNASSQEIIRVDVHAGLSPFEQLQSELSFPGVTVKRRGQLGNRHFATDAEEFLVNQETLQIYHFAEQSELENAIQSISENGLRIGEKEISWNHPPHFFRIGNFLLLYEGEESLVLSMLDQQFGEPFLVGQVTRKPELPEVRTPTEWEKTVLTLYDAGRLFHPNEYVTLRGEYARQFAEHYDFQIRSALASDYDDMMTWFTAHQEIQEEFYLALKPQADDLPEAFKLFNELRKAYPEKLHLYGNLGIALAVTWDKPNPAVYDYAHHQRRTKSNLPSGLVDALGNFDYFLQSESVMQGRGQFLPWEFLVYVIDHRTPIPERQWALQNYLPKREMIGQSYSEVPYDTVMLNTNSQQCRLMGKDYTLPNLLAFGGVCAMQADFSSRVGKSLGVPAVYVGGQSKFGDLHAWVMWVELQSVNKQGIRFSLQSHGRYRGDNFYIGTLRDPQTGEEITDRKLELHLHTIGTAPVANRQSNLIMKALPIIAEKQDFQLEDYFDFLSRVVKLNPGNQAAWRELAKLAGSENLEKKHQRQFLMILNQFFDTFAGFPDFTWEIFDDLVAFEPQLKQKTKLYERLVGMYEAAGRPDLASQARMKLTDYLVQDGRLKEATQGLAFTTLKFADEGRFVIAMLDKIDELAMSIEGSEKELVPFYLQFLQKIPRKRFDSPSEYCIQMHERVILRMQALNQPAIAQQLQAELANIRAGQ